MAAACVALFCLYVLSIGPVVSYNHIIGRILLRGPGVAPAEYMIRIIVSPTKGGLARGVKAQFIPTYINKVYFPIIFFCCQTSYTRQPLEAYLHLWDLELITKGDMIWSDFVYTYFY